MSIYRLVCSISFSKLGLILAADRWQDLIYKTSPLFPKNQVAKTFKSNFDCLIWSAKVSKSKKCHQKLVAKIEILTFSQCAGLLALGRRVGAAHELPAPPAAAVARKHHPGAFTPPRSPQPAAESSTSPLPPVHSTWCKTHPPCHPHCPKSCEWTGTVHRRCRQHRQ